ncbi:MAG: lactate utilization protein B [Candidatus Cyclobacteriaceae bacterium M3_2C_046]
MNHPKAAAEFNQDVAKTLWHDETLWWIRQKRDKISATIPEWEELRSLASQIKAHTISHLDQYLEQFEANAQANGIQVHWAGTALDHNEIVYQILQKHQVKKLVKSKSMLTEDCKLNRYLEQRGIEVVDTDLGEHIMQLLKEPPSHIVLPAIHKKKEEISKLFHEKIGTEAGNNDPVYLTESARQHLRAHFLSGDAALTGVNFAVADTGGFVVCTNEGNADLGVHLAPVHIASMGLEKIIPRQEHLGVFLRLLARSATGQPITAYSSHFTRPAPGQELHVVLVDGGRSAHLGMKDFYKSLYCIRCGACMNTCPVYRRSGGQSYDYTVPGPIGSILSPHVNQVKYASLPFASSLCGSCSDVCPVKIDIHEQLYKWRQHLTAQGKAGKEKRFPMQVMAWLFSHPKYYRLAGKIARQLLRLAPRQLVYNSRNVWGKAREVPAAPKHSFREWYLNNKNGRSAK